MFGEKKEPTIGEKAQDTATQATGKAEDLTKPKEPTLGEKISDGTHKMYDSVTGHKEPTTMEKVEHTVEGKK